MSKEQNKPEGYIFGRPTIYKKEYCEKLIDWMREGKSFQTFASTIPCSIDTISQWVHRHEDFSEAKRIGKALEQAWWDNLHRRVAATGEGNITAIVWAQKNKFPKYYRERLAKQQVELKQNLNHAITGDFKSIVATLTPDQMYQLSLALEQKAKEIEATHEEKNAK